MHKDTLENEYQRPNPRGSLNVFGYGDDRPADDRLASSEPSGGNRQAHRSDVYDVNKERLFCNFGVDLLRSMTTPKLSV